MFKVNQRIEIGTKDIAGRDVWEPARVMRRTKVMGELPKGFVPVRFDADGARLLVHENGIRAAGRAA